MQQWGTPIEIDVAYGIHRARLFDSPVTKAAIHGDLDTLLRYEHLDKSTVFYLATTYARFNVLTWLHQCHKFIPSMILLDMAVVEALENGHSNIFIWISEHYKKPSSHACIFAAREGKLRALKVLAENGYDMNEQVCVAAAANNRVAVLQWLSQITKSWNIREVFEAAKQSRDRDPSQYQCFNWLHDICSQYAKL